MAAAAEARPVTRLSAAVARRWANDNLFGSLGNTLLTIVTSLLLAFVAYQLLIFVFRDADWQVIMDNRRLFFLGVFPRDEGWRIWACIYFVAAVAGLSARLWLKPTPLQVGAAVAALVLLFLFATPWAREMGLIALGVFAAGFAFGSLIGTRWRLGSRIATAGWLLAFPVTIFFLTGDGLVPFVDLGFEGVRTRLWSGFMLNILIAIVGIFVSFPVGVLLALGRASSLPVIRLASTAYIELIRGVPLVTILFMAWLVLPRFLPEGLDGADLVVRIMIAYILFSAAYIAEVVRGGLQSIPRGQREAAAALGLGTVTTLGYIVLPQAIRNVIPALVSQFISLFKDTSLVFIVGLTDILEIGRNVTAQREFIGHQQESLLFVALVFWLITFPMSRLSQGLERRLGVGER